MVGIRLSSCLRIDTGKIIFGLPLQRRQLSRTLVEVEEHLDCAFLVASCIEQESLQQHGV